MTLPHIPATFRWRWPPPTTPATPVMVGLVLAQDSAQVGLVPDEGAVQELAPASADPAFGYRVAPHRQLHLIRWIGTDASG
jgi:hypothetical protein